MTSISRRRRGRRRRERFPLLRRTRYTSSGSSIGGNSRCEVPNMDVDQAGQEAAKEEKAKRVPAEEKVSELTLHSCHIENILTSFALSYSPGSSSG